MLKRDENGTYPLSEKEYASLKAMGACYNTAINSIDDLEARYKTTEICKNRRAWWHVRSALDHLSRAMTACFETIPMKKRRIVLEEFGRLTADIRVRRLASDNDITCYTIVDEAVLWRLIARATSVECWSCGKCGKEVKRCQMHQDLMACMPYEIGPQTGEDIKQDFCPFSNGVIFPDDVEGGEDNEQAETNEGI